MNDGWINTENGLPVGYNLVLIYLECGDYMLGFYEDGKWYNEESELIDLDCELPVCWQPLPLRPKWED